MGYFIGGLILSAAGWMLIPSWWRGGLAGDAFFSDHLNRALLGNVGFLSGLTSLVGLGLAEEQNWISLTATRVLAVLLIAMTIGSFLAVVTIYLFNWPKWMVPPRQRSLAGQLTESRNS